MKLHVEHPEDTLYGDEVGDGEGHRDMAPQQLAAASSSSSRGLTLDLPEIESPTRSTSSSRLSVHQEEDDGFEDAYAPISPFGTETFAGHIVAGSFEVASCG